MKTFVNFSGMVRLILTAFFLVSSFALLASGRRPPVQANGTNYFEISGMTCNACAKGIASELRRIPAVFSATVTFTNQLAVVVIDTNYVSQTTLVKTIEEAGYKAKPKSEK